MPTKLQKLVDRWKNQNRDIHGRWANKEGSASSPSVEAGLFGAFSKPRSSSPPSEQSSKGKAGGDFGFINLGKSSLSKEAIATLDRSIELKAKHGQLSGEVTKLLADSSKDPQERARAVQEVRAQQAKVRAEFEASPHEQVMKNYLDTLITPASREAAEKKVNKEVTFSKAIADHVGGLENYDKMRGQVVDAYALMNGHIHTVKKVEVSMTQRASANAQEEVVRIYQPTARQVHHEVAGHMAESSNPELHDAAKSFLLRRAADAPPKKLSDMADLVYRDNEIAYPDKFIDPYVGKVYDHLDTLRPDAARKAGRKQMGSTEVLSMGLEHFTSPNSMTMLYSQDKEHFFLIAGMLEHLKNKKQK